MRKILQEFKEMLISIKREMNELKKVITLSTILNKDVLTLKEASLFTGYSEKYLYKLNSTGSDIPIYSSCDNGKLYFKREELLQWMTQKRKNNSKEFQSEVDNYLLMSIA